MKEMWGVEGSEGVEEVCVGGGRKCGGMQPCSRTWRVSGAVARRRARSGRVEEAVCSFAEREIARREE